MDFDKLKIAKAYTLGRKLNPNAVRVWKEAILKYVDASRIHQVLDLGCGAGRFFPFLQELFPSSKVIGIDPSKEMIAEAQKTFANSSIELIEGAAENLPLSDNSVDLVFMCMAYHAFEDTQKAVSEINRVLRPKGCVIIKQAVKEANRKHSFFDFFSEALPIARNILPSGQSLIDAFTNQNFVLSHNELIAYERAKNWNEYFGTIKHRGISVLKLLPDEVFEKDLKQFGEFCEIHGGKGPVIDRRDLFVFRK